MAGRIHRPFKIIAFNANDIRRQGYEISKQLQGLHINVALLSDTHLKPHERFFTPNYHFYQTDRFPERNITMQTYAICAIRTLDKGEAYS
jgi:hypothetical protein